MKKIHSNLFFILWFLLSLDSHAQWLWQNPWPTGNHLYDVWALNDSTIIVDGGGGSILRTDDKGEFWKEIRINDYDFINGLMFLNSHIGFTIGNSDDKKCVLKTNDSGKNWMSFNIPTNFELYDLYFINENFGWIVGMNGSIFKTINGCLNWQEQSLELGAHLYSVFFHDSLNGWAVGEYGLITKTNNGGDSWDYYYLNNSEDLTSIIFTDPDSGWISGANNNWQGTILATTDGGTSWVPQFTTSNIDPILNIFSFNNQKLWACSNAGNFMKTVNGGLNWTLTPSDNNFSLNSLCFLNDSIGYCVGFNGRIFRTNDGGNYWGKISRAATYAELKAIKMVDENTGWSVGSNGVILKTNDGGKSWILQSFAQPIFANNTNASINFYSLALINSMDIWIAGNVQDSTYNTHGIITYSHNGGQTWEFIPFAENDGFLDINFINDSVGWALAWNYYDRILYKTTNGGQSWTIVWVDSTISGANKIEFINASIGWISKLATDTLLKTINGGTSWTNQVIGFPHGIGDLYFSDDQQGWVAGGYEIFGNYPLGGEGYIYNTSDGGNTWMLQKQITKDMFIGIDFFDNLYGTTVGYNGTIYHTEDGGINWDSQPTSMLWTINDIDFINSEKAWICGSAGAILFTDTGGITQIHNPSLIYSLPEKITLFQNYPNPFNDNTTIEFSIAQGGKVKVEIFNILGELQNNLLNKYLIPGKYKVNWFGSNTSGERIGSGIYFYRVENQNPNGKISKTRKMIFIK